MNTLKKYIILFCSLAITWQINAQSIGIEECYKLAKENYPLAKQKDLIVKSKDYNMQNALKGYLPQVNLVGQASYQSDVTSVDLPASIANMVNIEKPAKDQYKLYGEVAQTLYDGGIIKQQGKIYEANATADLQRIEVELYKLNERVTDLYFGILLISEQLHQNELFKKDIKLVLSKVESSVANGVSLKSNATVLQAEMVKAEQHNIELSANRRAYINMLSELIHKPLNEETNFIKPPVINTSENINRPELKLFEAQNKIIEAQTQMIKAKNLPKLGLFFQGGAGRPALNMLSNKFDPYFAGGLRLTIPLTGYYTQKNDLALLSVNRLSNEVQKETFLFNTHFELKKQNEEIDKLNQLINTDTELISLRESVKKSSVAQLENGVINSNDYLRELNAEDIAKQNKIMHELQLLMALYKQKITSGN